jgi:hypothetical protein
MSPWTFQVGLNVTVDKTWVDVTSRHLRALLVPIERVPCSQPRRFTVLVSNGQSTVKFFAGFAYMYEVLKRRQYIVFRILMFNLFGLNSQYGYSNKLDI